MQFIKLRIFLFVIVVFLSCGSRSQSTASSQVSKFKMEAPQLDTIKTIWIYLPESYEDSDKFYPVIYMHDAQNLFDRESSYIAEWKVDETLDSLSRPEAIIVGIEHGGDKRIDELTPFPNEKYGGGQGNSYIDFIISTLKPHVDSTYRTLPDKPNTGIFGSSLGGLLSFYAAIKHPTIFGKIGVYSPSFWFSDEIYDLTKKTNLNTETKFYFLAGTEESEEMQPAIERMLRILQDRGLKSNNFKLRFVKGGEHNENLWSSNFAETYLWLME